MNTGVISKRYAKALYMYAEKAGKLKQVYDEMSVMANNYLLIPGLRKALDNPLLPMNDKIKLLCNAAGGKVSQEVERFITLVLHERREKFMQFIACSYIDLYRKQNNILRQRIGVDGSHVRLDRVLNALDLGCQLVGHAAKFAKLVDLALNFCVAHL